MSWTGAPDSLTRNRPKALVDLYRSLEATVKEFSGVEVVARPFADFRKIRSERQARLTRRLRSNRQGAQRDRALYARGFRPLHKRRTDRMRPVLLATAVALLVAAPPLRAPKAVNEQLPHLSGITSVAALPQALRDGRFKGADGAVPSHWALADPNAPFNSGDAIQDPSLPSRQLVFAGCDATLCVLHYRRGGSGESDNIIALTPAQPDWKVIWFASGHPPLPSFDALKKLLRGDSTTYYYTTTDSRGDLF